MSLLESVTSPLRPLGAFTLDSIKSPIGLHSAYMLPPPVCDSAATMTSSSRHGELAYKQGIVQEIRH